MISTNESGQTFPGLTLKGWAYVRSDGTLQKGFNVASSVKNSVGTYTVTWSVAMSTIEAMAKLQPNPYVQGYKSMNIARNSALTGSIQVLTMTDSALADCAFYVEMWE